MSELPVGLPGRRCAGSTRVSRTREQDRSTVKRRRSDADPYRGMDTPNPRTPGSLADLDLGGLACFVLTLWGLVVVVRGAVIATCPGCVSATMGRALVVTGTLLLAASSIVVWTRGSRVAASAIAGPGLIASVALVAVPGVPLHLLGLALVPWAIAGARGAIRNARPREIAVAVWVFGPRRSSGRPALASARSPPLAWSSRARWRRHQRSCSTCRGCLTSFPTT